MSEQLPIGQRPACKILIIDDEEAVGEFLSDALLNYAKDAHYQVRYANGGAEALKIANEFEPDVAIVDIKMQHMWGDELIRRFQAGEAHCPKDFVIFTGTDTQEFRKKSANAGYTFLTKSAQMEDIFEAVKKICIKHKLFEKI